MDLKMPDTNYFMLRLALLIAPFAVVDGATRRTEFWPGLGR
jgi:hypothetical protein